MKRRKRRREPSGPRARPPHGRWPRTQGQPSNVPGYVGTDVPQTGHTADGMNAAAQRTLADPNDAGGAVGTFVVEATLSRPDVTVTATDPGVQRADAVQNSPTDTDWQANGLASGTVRACGMDLDDAGDSGRCGGVTYCVGAGCERVDTPANTAFVPAAAQLNMVMEMGGDEFDRDNMSIFTGEHRACPIRLLGGQNCCTDSGVFIELGLAGCTVEERELAEARAAGVTHYLGEYCAKRILGICRRRDRAWCVFTSELGRILHEQARPQLGHELGRLPRIHRRGNAAHRFRSRGPLRIHRHAARHEQGAGNFSAGRGCDRVRHARADRAALPRERVRGWR